METAQISKSQINKPLYRVMTANVSAMLSPEQIQEAFNQLLEKMKVPDPDNPNLWVVVIGKYKLWGILDHGAGPDQEDLLTLLFPEDY